MIINDRGMFIHIPKTAGISVGKLFDPEYKGNHRIPTEDLSKYYVFTFVRNPFDRFVSAFKYQKILIDKNIHVNLLLRKRMKDLDFDFEKFVMSLHKSELKHSTHYKQQKLWIDPIKYDLIGKVENFNADLSIALKACGVGDLINKVGHFNKSGTGDTYEYITNDKIKNKLYDLYREDFKLLSY